MAILISLKLSLGDLVCAREARQDHVGLGRSETLTPLLSRLTRRQVHEGQQDVSSADITSQLDRTQRTAGLGQTPISLAPCFSVNELTS